jgi:hypothetical protein
MTDGLRWQEVFSGAEENLMNKQNGKVTDVAALKKSYWRTTPADRRLALMPFLWNVIAKRGQIFGNRQLGSDAYVTNGFFFSYPGTTKRFAVSQILASIATIKCQTRMSRCSSGSSASHHFKVISLLLGPGTYCNCVGFQSRPLRLGGQRRRHTCYATVGASQSSKSRNPSRVGG